MTLNFDILLESFPIVTLFIIPPTNIKTAAYRICEMATTLLSLNVSTFCMQNEIRIGFNRICFQESGQKHEIVQDTL